MPILTNLEPRILLYADPRHPETETLIINLKAFCHRQGLGLMVAGPDDLDQPLGLVSGIFEETGMTPKPDEQAVTGEPPVDLVLYLLCGLDVPTRDRVLKALQADGLGRGALKAMATDHNIHWQLRHVLADVSQEHAIMGAYMELRETLRVVMVLNESVGLPPAVQAEFDAKVAQGMSWIEGGKIPTDVPAMQDLTRTLKWLITLGETDVLEGDADA